MILLDLFLGFLRVGCFAFGGAYGAIPLIRDVVLSYGWMDDEALTALIAVSESTPGPIMVNIATFVGSRQAGFWGAALATLAVVLPSFCVILLVTAVLKAVWKNGRVQAVLSGLKPCISGIILAVGAYMLLDGCFLDQRRLQVRNLGITLVLAAVFWLFPKYAKKRFPPVFLILIAAVLGAVVYHF